MIKRLKRKYVLIVMIAVTLVLGIIITAINITSYSSLNSQLYDKLTLIVENEGKMPDFPLPDTPDEDPDTESDPESDPESDTEAGADVNTETDGENTEGKEEGSDGKDKEEGDKEKEEEKEDVRDSMSPETPFETRYFTAIK